MLGSAFRIFPDLVFSVRPGFSQLPLHTEVRGYPSCFSRHLITLRSTVSQDHVLVNLQVSTWPMCSFRCDRQSVMNHNSDGFPSRTFMPFERSICLPRTSQPVFSLKQSSYRIETFLYMPYLLKLRDFSCLIYSHQNEKAHPVIG